jgi:hypothetical protein
MKLQDLDARVEGLEQKTHGERPDKGDEVLAPFRRRFIRALAELAASVRDSAKLGLEVSDRRQASGSEGLMLLGETIPPRRRHGPRAGFLSVNTCSRHHGESKETGASGEVHAINVSIGSVEEVQDL